MKTTKKSRYGAGALLLFASVLPSRFAHAQQPPSTGPSPSPNEQAPAAPPATPGEICSNAYERSQTEKLAGHYVAATAAALECSQLMCNAAIVRECERFYAALEQETPTLVFSARKAEGGELTNVRVEMDGKLVAEQMTGRPLAVDPGPHEFVFIHPERGRQQVSETARVGDHARVLEVAFTDPKAPPTPAAVAPPPAPVARKSRVPAVTYVLGGVAVVALGSFVYFRVRGVNDYNEYNATCTPVCNRDDVDAVRQKFLFSYVSLGVGIASAAGAGVAFLVNRGSHAPVQASVTAHGDGAMAGLKTTF